MKLPSAVPFVLVAVVACGTELRGIVGGNPPATGDAIEVTSVAVHGDELVLEVTHGGGCADHEYTLYWDSGFLESDPVQVHLTLVHDAAGDRCKALVSEELRFDLRPLRESWRSGYQMQSGSMSLVVFVGEERVGTGFYTF